MPARCEIRASARAGDLWQPMYRRKKSTTQTCQPQQIDSVRTTSNLGLLRPSRLHLAASGTDAALVAQGAASCAGPEALFLVPKTPPGVNPRIISTCTNRSRNSRRISTCKTKDFNLPRMSTCRKSTRNGGLCHSSNPRVPRMMSSRGRLFARKSAAANVMDIRSFAALAKTSGAFARQQSGRGICFSGPCLARPCLNPCRISTSETKDFKPPEMSTCRKRNGGVHQIHRCETLA
jgi:hypothetical protein